ncbi:MAG TPA: twin-arginine translocase subunit TatC [Solirubrobacteraceae bacterium]|nr:twin-arginine translocase subunit TatC [Solirubrobacteraceae bacterium]
MKALRPISHDERLSVIDHLDELRSRIIVSGAMLLVVFLFCFWQNGPLLSVLNRALPSAPTSGLGSQQRVNAGVGGDLRNAAASMQELSRYLAQVKNIPPGVVKSADSVSRDLAKAGNQYPKTAQQQEKPITIGPGESFTTTITVAGYFALMITLPFLLYQLYAFVIPALSRDERRIALPAMIAAPFLFVIGVVFTYFAVVPPAIHFLQGYNSSHFQVLIQAKSYYKFEILLMLGIGLAFEVPLVLLALQKVGVITASTLTLNWRYATVLIAVIAAALPGVDPVTMMMETLPLVLLYLASIVLLKFVEHRNARRLAAEAGHAAQPQGN